MKSKLFGKTNPNDILFNVEVQEGSDILEGDEGTASIGDATMEHIQRMNNHSRVAYDEFVHMNDGNIFRMEDNLSRFEDMTVSTPVSQEDADQKISERMKKLHKLERDLIAESGSKTPSSKKIYAISREKEIIEEELDILEAYSSDDLMGHRDSLVPYENWEEFGGMSKHWEIPSTPKPSSVFAGNSRQMFYDDFPEDYPLANLVNQVLFTLDQYERFQILTRSQIFEHNRYTAKPIIRLDNGLRHFYSDNLHDYLCVEDYVEFLEFITMESKADFEYRTKTYEALSEMVLAIGREDNAEPDELVSKMLKKLDHFHFNNYKYLAAMKTRNSDPLFAHLCKFGRETIQLAKKGKNVYNELKAFGKELFDNGFLAMKEFQAGELCNRSCKKEFGCTINEPGHLLSGVFATVQKPSPGRHGQKSYHWAKYHEIKKKVEELQSKRLSKKSELVIKCIERMEKVRDEAIKTGSLRKFTGIPSSLIGAQKSGTMVLTPSEWNTIWAAYNTCKQQVSSGIQRGNNASEEESEAR